MDERLVDEAAEAAGAALMEAATAVRRYKSANALPLSAELDRLYLAVRHPALAHTLREARADLASIARAKAVEVSENGEIPPYLETVMAGDALTVALALNNDSNPIRRRAGPGHG